MDKFIKSIDMFVRAFEENTRTMGIMVESIKYLNERVKLLEQKMGDK